MKEKLLLVLGTFAFFVLLLLVFLGLGIYNTYNDAVQLENSLIAQLSSDKNTYDNYFKTIKEMAQVNDMYTNDLRKVYDGAIQGRYGEHGSQAVFQFIKEHNPNFDTPLYTNLQNAIQSGRLDFKTAQDTRIDKVRNYQNFLDVGITGWIATGLLHFPRKFTVAELNDKYGKPVTSSETEKAFDTMKSETIRIR